MLMKESASKIVYHTTGYQATLDILKTNKFDLTTNLGTSADQIGASKFYYFSVSRVKYGGYARSMSAAHIITLVLDGDKFNNRFKAGPVDYWGQEFRPKTLDRDSRLRNDENEERIFSDKASIPNASSYILEIHINTAESGGASEDDYWNDVIGHDKYSQIKSIIDLGENQKIPVFVYNNLKSFVPMDKRKALNKTNRDRRSLIFFLVDALKNGWKNLPDTSSAKSVKEFFARADSSSSWYTNQIDEFAKLIANEIHNTRTSDSGKLLISQLTELMKKYRVKSIPDLLRAATIKQERTMKTIKITKEFAIPGTEIILEAGDQICIKEYSDYDYVRDQLARLTTGTFAFQFRDDAGNMTKWMNMDAGAWQALEERFS